MSKPFGSILFNKKRSVNIQRDFYAMAKVDGDTAEITMYGEVVEQRPTDWYGNPVKGDFIILDEFMEDLDRIASAKNITIRMNSVGGEVYAALPIHNRLRELKAEITVIVDGVAMSAASFIMCAADNVKASAASLVMVHKSAVFLFGGYNADEMRQMTTWLDTVDKAIVSAYVRKSGKSEDEILAMMADTTYMTGQEALDNGFVDELIDGESPSIAASADGSTLYVDGRAIRLSSPVSNLPKSIPLVKTGEEPDMANKNQPATTGGNEGGKTMAQTLEELRKENPELANQLMAEAQAAASSGSGNVSDAIEAERKRIADIDAVAALYDSEVVQEAKYGEKPCTAQEMTYRAAQKMVKQGKKFLADLEDDTSASGAQDVGAAPGNDDGNDDTPEKIKAEAKRAAETYKKVKGGKDDE